MKKCRITVMRITQYEDLMAQYENPIDHACTMQVGQVLLRRAGKSQRAFARVRGTRSPPLCWRSATGRRTFTRAG